MATAKGSKATNSDTSKSDKSGPVAMSLEDILKQAGEAGGEEIADEKSQTLAVGKGYSGKYMGRADFKVHDELTGVVKDVQAFRIATTDGEVKIAGAAMLNKKMETVQVGATISIGRRADIPGKKGRRIGDYVVIVHKG